MTSENAESIRKLFRLAVPLALQFLLFNSMTLIDVAMLSQTGEVEIGASGLADKTVFVLLMVLINLAGAAGVLCAQYWGAEKKEKFRAVLALALLLCTAFGLVSSGATFLFAEELISLGTSDPATIIAGESYVAWLCWSFIPASLVIPLETGLRCVDRANIPTYYSLIEVGLNIALNYCLILGNFGFPELGIEGAGIGSLVARTARATALVAHVYLREKEVALRPADFARGMSGVLARQFARISGPMLLNGLFWSAGFSTAHFIYGRMGVSEVALMTVTWGILRFAISLFSAIGIASSISVGHALGANQPTRAWTTVWAATAASGVIAVAISTFLVVCRDPLLGLFPALGERAMDLSVHVFWLVPVELLFRAVNVTLILGGLRAGGDVKFVLGLDIVCAWLVGLPLAYLAAFHWGMPLMAVYGFALFEEGSKSIAVLWRTLRRGWLKNLVDAPGAT